MITDELSTGIIEAVKTKLPQKDNLANTLMDILYRKRSHLSPFKRRSTLYVGRSGYPIKEIRYIPGYYYRNEFPGKCRIRHEYRRLSEPFRDLFHNSRPIRETVPYHKRGYEFGNGNFIEHHSTDSFNEARYTFQIQAIQMDVPKRKHEMQAFR